MLMYSLVVCLAGCLQFAVAVYTPEKETEIRSETVLAASYDPISRPASQTHVQISLSILAIDELDIKIQKLTSAGWLTLEWTDSRLAWNKTAKDDIEYIFAQPSTIWRPEIFIDNSLADLGVIHDDYLQLRIRYDGTVEWEPPLLFTTHCDVLITFYPYDEQQCTIELVSWGYNYDEIKLEHSASHVNLEDYVENGEWQISLTHVDDKNLTEHTSNGIVYYPQLDFKFYLERRSSYYNLNVMMPVFLTSLLVVLVFVVPVACGEKLSYVLTVLLSLAVLLTLVNSSLPSTSVSTSILGVYLGIVLVLAAIAVLLTVIIILTFYREGGPDKSSFMFTVARFAAKITCSTLGKSPDVPTTRVMPFDDDTETKDAKQREPDCDVTWQDISEALNRLCFVSFMIVTIIMNVLFVLLLSFGGKTNQN